MLAKDISSSVREACAAVLEENWREGRRIGDGVPFAYTCPSPGHYPWQFYWDSCFTAITWRRFEPGYARRELATLLAAQQHDGFIGHTIFWNTPLRGVRRLTYNVVSRESGMTASIQPPALAWAWRIAVGDPREEPGIARQHEWLLEHRSPSGDGLLWLVQPDESGLDASPQFDAIWGRRAHSLVPGFVELVRRNRSLDYDLRRIEADGGPICCEPLTNVLWSLSRMSLGLPSLTEAIIERLYDERAGLFRPAARPEPASPPQATIASLSPLALPDLPEEIGRRLVEEHLLDPERFWLPIPPASVPITEPGFSRNDKGGLGQKRYWRGPTWINTAWLVWLGLIRLGYDEPAAELVRRLATTIDTSGLREYYDPYTGAGMGAHSFGWSTLIMEMIDPDPRAATSYL